jgi:hypothetical protein
MPELSELLKHQAQISRGLARKLTEFAEQKSLGPDRARRLEGLLVAVEKMMQELPDSSIRTQLEAWVGKERGELATMQEELRFGFVRQLQQRLTQSKFALRGQLPVLRCGGYTIRVDLEAGLATIYWGPEVEKLKTGVVAHPETIAEAIESIDRQLQQRSIDGARLLELLFQTYEEFRAENRLAVGEKVLLVDLLARLVWLVQPKAFRNDPIRERLREYSRVNLGLDIWRLRQSGQDLSVKNQKLKLTVATFDATLDRRRALWIPEGDEGEGTYYSYLSFSQQ